MANTEQREGATIETVETSYAVLRYLESAGQAGVTAVAEECDISKSAAHRHLSTLVAQNQARKEGQTYAPTTDHAQGVPVTIRIIEGLQDLGAASTAELADHLGMSTQTVASYLERLDSEEFVVFDGQQYQNSFKFLDIGDDVLHDIGIFDIVEEEVDDLAASTGEVALFSVLEHGKNVLLYKSAGENAIQTAHEAGLREPLHCSALGKAILSSLPRDQVDTILDDSELESFTENTITDRAELLEELETTRERGYALDREEAKPGIHCVAAPVTSEDERFYGAVSVTAPKSRMRGDRLTDEIPELVTGTANVIEVSSIYV